MKVKDQLKVIEKDQYVHCLFYAYGINCGSSMQDGMATAGDCLDNLRYDCLNAKVLKVNPSSDGTRVVIHAEVV